MAVWTDIPDFGFRDGLGYQDVNEIKNNIIVLRDGDKEFVKIAVGAAGFPAPAAGAVAVFHGLTAIVNPISGDVVGFWGQGSEVFSGGDPDSAAIRGVDLLYFTINGGSPSGNTFGLEAGILKPYGDVNLGDAASPWPLINGYIGVFGVGDGLQAGGAVATFHGQYVSPLIDDGSSGVAKTIDWDLGNEHKVLLTGNVTFTLTNPVDGGRYVIKLQQDGTGGRTVTWPASVMWPGGVTPTITAGIGKVDIVTMMWDATLTKYIAAINQGYN